MTEVDDLDEGLVPSSEADAYWERIAVPILAELEARAQKLSKLKPRLIHHGMLASDFDNCVDWLEMRGRVERFKHMAGGVGLRIPGKAYGAADEVEEPEVEAEEPAIEEPTAPTPARARKETNVAKEKWLTTKEAAELLGVTSTWFNTTKGVLDKLDRREREGGRGFEYSRASIIRLRDERRKGGGAAPEKPARTIAPKVARAPRAAAPAMASTSDAIAAVRWVLEGHRLGRFTAEQAVAQIGEVVS